MNDSETRKMLIGVGERYPQFIEFLRGELEGMTANLVSTIDEIQVRRLQGQAQFLVKLIDRLTVP